jgi:hypothetical protein
VKKHQDIAEENKQADEISILYGCVSFAGIIGNPAVFMSVVPNTETIVL